jgi:carboxymethylenebutenolidase
MASGESVTFPSNGGEAHGYLVLPPSGRGPGLIVIQEWWGVTDHVRDVTERFAKEGFVALAPDLYGGRTTHDPDEAGRMMQELPVDQAARDLSGAVDFLLAHDAVTSESVGAVGFCMGGGFVIVLANLVGEKCGAAVPFYGVLKQDYGPLSGITAPVLGHFAADDGFYPPEQAKALEAKIREESGASVRFEIHEGVGHAFFNDENRIGTYDEAAATRAWNETLDFLRQNLGLPV